MFTFNLLRFVMKDDQGFLEEFIKVRVLEVSLIMARKTQEEIEQFFVMRRVPIS